MTPRRIPDTLSERELGLVQELLVGRNFKDTAIARETTPNNVYQTLRQLRLRFAVRSNFELVAELFRRGILS